MAMTPRQLRVAYRTATLAALSTAGWFAWLAYETAARVDAVIDVAAASTTPVTDPPADPEPKLDPDLACWKRDLRRPLYDPPPPPPPPKPPPAPIRSRLLGTILEADASTAMIQLPSGGVEFRRVGDPLGPQDPGAVVKSIAADRVSIDREGEVVDLTVQPGR